MSVKRIGTGIRPDIFQEKRAGYGEQVVVSLSRQLTAKFGRGFSRRNLDNMAQFAVVFPDLGIVQSLIAQLGWTIQLARVRLERREEEH